MPYKTETLPLFSVTQQITKTVRIEFDGGTPCNIPRLGYGDGYGSYKIDDQPVYRLNFRIPMSCNVAEMTTILRAVQAVAQNHNPHTTKLDIYGDSQTALKRCLVPIPKKRRQNGTEFSGTANMLFTICAQFAQVTTHWRGRAASVRLFGH